MEEAVDELVRYLAAEAGVSASDAFEAIGQGHLIASAPRGRARRRRMGRVLLLLALLLLTAAQ